MSTIDTNWPAPATFTGPPQRVPHITAPWGAPRRLFAAMGNLIAHLVARLIRFRQARADMRALRGLDDRMLRDIGLTRTGLEHAVQTGQRPDEL
jgi:uncharacterized protein YjiS (DUF1127 family)